MFEPTIPFGEPELMRVSAFRRYLDELDTSAGPLTSSRLASLSPSLMADLMRFEASDGGSEVLEVLAACLRHARDVTIHLSWGDKVAPLTVFAQQRLVHCPIPMESVLAGRLAEMSVLQVEPATRRPPGDAETALIGDAAEYHALSPLLWELALRGRRDALLPEIAGPVAYRLAPGLDFAVIRLNGALTAGVERLQRHASTLREIADWPGFDRERATRLLNGLYLQAGLIVTRASPAALNDSWFGGLGI